jgi:hypothetical protein
VELFGDHSVQVKARELLAARAPGKVFALSKQRTAEPPDVLEAWSSDDVDAVSPQPNGEGFVMEHVGKHVAEGSSDEASPPVSSAPNTVDHREHISKVFLGGKDGPAVRGVKQKIQQNVNVSKFMSQIMPTTAGTAQRDGERTSKIFGVSVLSVNSAVPLVSEKKM